MVHNHSPDITEVEDKTENGHHDGLFKYLEYDGLFKYLEYRNSNIIARVHLLVTLMP